MKKRYKILCFEDGYGKKYYRAKVKRGICWLYLRYTPVKIAEYNSYKEAKEDVVNYFNRKIQKKKEKIRKRVKI
jgi:thiamine phosphate synthase YjbQ (UPF0047 family)